LPLDGLEELRVVLEKAGFTNVSVTAKMGLLYAVAQKRF